VPVITAMFRVRDLAGDAARRSTPSKSARSPRDGCGCFAFRAPSRPRSQGHQRASEFTWKRTTAQTLDVITLPSRFSLVPSSARALDLERRLRAG